jgi:hypothetical protein
MLLTILFLLTIWFNTFVIRAILQLLQSVRSPRPSSLVSLLLTMESVTISKRAMQVCQLYLRNHSLHARVRVCQCL